MELNYRIFLLQFPVLFDFIFSQYYVFLVIPHIYQCLHTSFRQKRTLACCPPPPSYIMLIIWDSSSTFCHHS